MRWRAFVDGCAAMGREKGREMRGLEIMWCCVAQKKRQWSLTRPVAGTQSQSMEDSFRRASRASNTPTLAAARLPLAIGGGLSGGCGRTTGGFAGRLRHCREPSGRCLSPRAAKAAIQGPPAEHRQRPPTSAIWGTLPPMAFCGQPSRIRHTDTEFLTRCHSIGPGWDRRQFAYNSKHFRSRSGTWTLFRALQPRSRDSRGLAERRLLSPCQGSPFSAEAGISDARYLATHNRFTQTLSHVNMTDAGPQDPHVMAARRVFEILGSAAADACTARLGRIAFGGRRVIDTPNFTAVTSRGAIPHLTPDNVGKHTSVDATYMALEDCE